MASVEENPKEIEYNDNDNDSDSDNESSSRGMILLGILILLLMMFGFWALSEFSQATYKYSFGSADLSYSPAAALMSA